MLTEGHPEICAQIEACNGIQALVAPLHRPCTIRHCLLCCALLGAGMRMQLPCLGGCCPTPCLAACV